MNNMSASKKIYEIKWRLLPSCSNKCHYCPFNNDNNNFILVKERIFNIIDKIIQFSKGDINLNFDGGEPSLHPLFQDIISYLVHNRAGGIHITINTIMTYDANYFVELARSFDPGLLTINIMIHPSKVDLKNLLIFLAKLGEQKIEYSTTLFWNESCENESTIIANALKKFTSLFPFQKAVIQANGHKESFIQWKAKNDIDSQFLTFPVSRELPEIQEAVSDDVFCIMGERTLRIDPDGRFYGAFCAYAPANPPLWEIQPEFARGIIKCPGAKCELNPAVRPAHFSSMEAARNSLLDTKPQSAFLSLPQCAPDDSELLEHLATLAKLPSREAFPSIFLAWLEQNKTQLCSIYEAIADADSRLTFLQWVLISKSGQKCHFECNPRKKFIEEFSSPASDVGKYCDHIKVVGINWAKELDRHKATILMHHPTIILDNPDLLDGPLSLLEAHPQYRLRFYRDATNGGLQVHASHPSGSASRVPSPKQTCDVTVVIPPSSDTKGLRNSICSALLQTAVSMEILIMDEGEDEEYSAECIGLSRKFPGNVHVLTKDVHTARDDYAILRMARGRNVGFLQAGDALMPEFLAHGVEVLAKEESDIAVYAIENARNGDAISTLTLVPGKYTGVAAIQAYLSENWGCGHLLGIIVNTDFLRQYNIKLGWGGIFTSLAFLDAIFFGTSITLTDPGYILKAAKLSPSQKAESNIVYRYVMDFCQKHGINELGEEVWAKWLKNNFANEADFLAWFSNNRNDSSTSLIFPQLIVKSFLDDLNNRGSSYNWDVRLPTESAESNPPIKVAAGHGNTPILSLIVLLENSLSSTLDYVNSLFANIPSDGRVEVVFIDNTGDTDIVLNAIAKHYPQAVILKAQPSTSEEFLRRYAIDAARGQLIAFPDLRMPLSANYIEGALTTPADAKLTFLLTEKDMGVTQSGSVMSAVAFPWYAKQIAAGYRSPRIYSRSFLQSFPFAGDLPQLIDDEGFVLAAIKRAGNIHFRKIGGAPAPLGRQSLTGLVHFWRQLSWQDSDAHEEFAPVVSKLMRQYFIPAWNRLSNQVALSHTDIISLLAQCPAFMTSLRQLLAAGEATQSPGGQWRKRKRRAVDNPLISVIVPAYNQEDYLGRALNSILNQDVESLEILVINDASTDGTAEICRKYAKLDGRIRILDMEINHGQGYGRNLALKQSRGEFVTFVDADDYLLPGFLLTAATDLLYNPDIDFVQGGKVDPKGSVYSLFPARRKLDGREMISLYLAEKIEYWECWGKLYRREFLLANDISFGEHLFEDEIFLLKAYSCARKLLIDPAGAYVYEKKVHPDSAMLPVKWTHRHIQGFLARCREVSNFVSRHPELNSDGNTGWRKLSKVYEYFRPLLLDYLGSKVAAFDSTLTDDDIAHLGSSLDFMRIFLEDYALMHMSSLAAPVEFVEEDAQSIDFEHLGGESQKSPLSILIVCAPDQDLESLLEKYADLPEAQIILLASGMSRQAYGRLPRLMETRKNLSAISASPYANSGRLIQVALKVATGQFVMIMENGQYPNISAIKTLMKKLPAEDAIFLGKIPDTSVIPETDDKAQEAAAIILADDQAANLSGWMFRSEFIKSMHLPDSDDISRELLLSSLLKAGSILWSNACIVTSLPPRQQEPRFSRRFFQGILNKLEYATATLEPMQQTDMGEFLSERWVQHFLQPASGNLTHLLAYILSFRGERINPALSNGTIEILGRFKPFLRQIFLNYGKLGGKMRRRP